MRRYDPRRALAVLAAVAAAMILPCGAAEPDKGAAGRGSLVERLTSVAGKSSRKKEPPPPKVDEVIANVAQVVGGDYRVEGVGLVVGLDNTGSDPAPGYHRQKLLDEMRKAGVEGAEKILARKDTSLVIVRLTIPAGVTPEDRIDAEVLLPPGSGTTSLAGGHLITTRLAQVAIAGGEVRAGNVLAKAVGPVMVGAEGKPGELTVGRVLGGARCLKEMPYNLVVKEGRKSARTTMLLQNAINARFHQSEGTDQKGLASAKTDQFIVLKVPKVYHHNQDRFFRVVKLLPLVDTPALRGERLERWGKELLDPKTAGVAAMRLEGLGSSAVPTLKTGLASTDATVKFFAAEALAYLRETDGVDALAEAAIKQPDFRAFALAALVALDDSAADLRLRGLLSEADVEVRYGAFNALRTLDERSQHLGRVRLLDEPEPEDDEADTMAMQIDAPRPKRKEAAAEDPFALYVVDCGGPPLIHIARTRRCEIVVFGRDQRLLTPIVLGERSLLLNASDGDETVELSRILSGAGGVSDLKVTSPLDVGEVIRSAANLGASYPDLVSILRAADAQKNLPGALVVDAVPVANPRYDEELLGLSKKDDQVKPASAESDKEKRPRFLGRLFNRKPR